MVAPRCRALRAKRPAGGVLNADPTDHSTDNDENDQPIAGVDQQKTSVAAGEAVIDGHGGEDKAEPQERGGDDAVVQSDLAGAEMTEYTGSRQ
jgi:hypothetical protein